MEILNNIKLKKALFFIFSFFFLSIFIFDFKKRPQIIPVIFSKNELPLVGIEIGKATQFMQFCLSSKYPISFSSELLEKIQKKSKGQHQFQDFEGDIQQYELFKISKLKLGNLKLGNIVANREIENFAECSNGTVAWPFDKGNLLLDFPRKRICAIKKDKDLLSLGLDLKKMDRVKFKKTNKAFCFDIVTPIGEIKSGINVTRYYNLINESKLTDNFYKKNQLSQLKIDNGEFIETRFVPAKFSSKLELDALLGTEFLKDHIVYIDAKNEFLYFGEGFSNAFSKTSFSKIPLQFSDTDLPLVEIEIGGEKRLAVIDLGSVFELTLRSKDAFPLDTLRYLQDRNSLNGLGEEQKGGSYLLPKYKIGNTLLKDVILHSKEEKPVIFNVKGKSKGIINSRTLYQIGRPILNRTNIYFDFPNAAMWFIKDQTDLKKINVDLKAFEKIPFELWRELIVLNVDTDLGVLKLMLDTGATANLLRSKFTKIKALENDEFGNSCFLSKKFVLGDSDYQKSCFLPLEITDKFGNIDGVLGMDFLGKHAFYIDYPNRHIYIQKPGVNTSH